MNLNSISSGLKLDADGIWRGGTHRKVSYPSHGSEDYFELEDHSFWFHHRNNCIINLVHQFPPVKGETIFDVGGGNGFVSRGLAEAGYETALVEPSEQGALNAKKRGLKTVICATTDTANFSPGALGAIGLFDVIEHIDNDLEFLKAMRGLLNSNGTLYATVPAYSALWSEEDVEAGHFRRYTKESIEEVLVSAGFEVQFSTYIFRPLPIPIFLLRSLRYRFGLSPGRSENVNRSKDHAVQNNIASKLLGAILKPEVTNIIHKKSMRMGGSCLIAARAI